MMGFMGQKERFWQRAIAARLLCGSTAVRCRRVRCLVRPVAVPVPNEYQSWNW